MEPSDWYELKFSFDSQTAELDQRIASEHKLLVDSKFHIERKREKCKHRMSIQNSVFKHKIHSAVANKGSVFCRPLTPQAVL